MRFFAVDSLFFSHSFLIKWGLQLPGRSSVSWATHACERERISEDSFSKQHDNCHPRRGRPRRLLIIAIHHRVWCFEAVFKDPEKNYARKWL